MLLRDSRADGDDDAMSRMWQGWAIRMSRVMRCDNCGGEFKHRENPVVPTWALLLDGNDFDQSPLDLCCAACVVAFLDTTVSEVRWQRSESGKRTAILDV